jgi:hypothetical protein
VLQNPGAASTLYTRYCHDESAQALVFVYKSSLKMAAPILNCTSVQQQQAMTHFLWSESARTPTEES